MPDIPSEDEIKRAGLMEIFNFNNRARPEITLDLIDPSLRAIGVVSKNNCGRNSPPPELPPQRVDTTITPTVRTSKRKRTPVHVADQNTHHEYDASFYNDFDEAEAHREYNPNTNNDFHEEKPAQAVPQKSSNNSNHPIASMRSIASKSRAATASGIPPTSDQQAGPSTAPVSSISSANRPARAAPGPKSFPCPVENCGKAYTTKKVLNKHTKRVHSSENASVHPCNRCDTILPTKTAWNKHLKAVHQSDYACNLCTQSFGRGNLLRKHIKSNHPEVDEADALVDIYLSAKGQKTGHVSIYLCDICDYNIVDKINFKDHVAKCHKESGTAATIARCLAATQTRDETILASFNCTLCRWRSCDNEDEKVVLHCQTAHLEKAEETYQDILRVRGDGTATQGLVKSFDCCVCNYSGNSGHNLLQHVKFRHDEYDVKQVLKFSRNKTAGAALKPQREVPWFECSLCGTSWRRLVNITRHFLRHHKGSGADSTLWTELPEAMRAAKEAERSVGEEKAIDGEVKDSDNGSDERGVGEESQGSFEGEELKNSNESAEEQIESQEEKEKEEEEEEAKLTGKTRKLEDGRRSKVVPNKE